MLWIHIPDIAKIPQRYLNKILAMTWAFSYRRLVTGDSDSQPGRSLQGNYRSL